ncbi:MAG: 4Fe-4S binding protein, partial [Flavobacteriales bacterium]
GNCSKYCEMGIDVKWYAQRGQNILRASCVGCGMCSTVCPRGVLNLENGPVKGRVSEDPILIGNDGVYISPHVASNSEN